MFSKPISWAWLPWPERGTEGLSTARNGRIPSSDASGWRRPGCSLISRTYCLRRSPRRRRATHQCRPTRQAPNKAIPWAAQQLARPCEKSVAREDARGQCCELACETRKREGRSAPNRALQSFGGPPGSSLPAGCCMPRPSGSSLSLLSLALWSGRTPGSSGA